MGSMVTLAPQTTHERGQSEREAKRLLRMQDSCGAKSVELVVLPLLLSGERAQMGQNHCVTHVGYTMPNSSSAEITQYLLDLAHTT